MKLENIENWNNDAKLKSSFLEKWKSEKESLLVEGKLGVLARCKESFSISHYLASNLYPDYKRAVAKVRVSAHKLPIEIERYVKTPRANRVCSLGCNVLGDEVHFLLECEHLIIKEVYTHILARLNKQCNEFASLSNKDKLLFLLTSSDNDILLLTGKLCHKVLNCFNEINW